MLREFVNHLIIISEYFSIVCILADVWNGPVSAGNTPTLTFHALRGEKCVTASVEMR